MGKTKKKKRKGKRNNNYFGFEFTPANPYSKKVKLIGDIVIGATEEGYSDDARVFSFFRLHGSVYVLVDGWLFKYQPEEDEKYIYMEGMYEPALGESISNKSDPHPNWMAYGWSELEEIKSLGIEELEKITKAIPWDDDFELAQYFQNENNFFPGEFTEGFLVMDEEQQDMFLSLLGLKIKLEKLDSEVEALDNENDMFFDDEDYHMLQYGGTIINGVYYTEEQRQWMDYWMAKGNWEAVWEMQGLNSGSNNKPKKKIQKHPSDIFNQESKKINLKIHELAHQLYRKHRKGSGDKLRDVEIEEVILELVNVAEKENYKITTGQSKHYFTNNIKKLEKAYLKSIKQK